MLFWGGANAVDNYVICATLSLMKHIIIAFLLVLSVGPVSARAENVYYNTSSKIYHKHGCKWAKKCTKSCVTVEKASAKAHGGRACHVCGG